MPDSSAFEAISGAQSGRGDIVALLGDTVACSEAARARLTPGAAFLGPEPQLFPWLSVAENVAFGAQGLDAFAREGLVAHALARLQLEDYGQRPVQGLPAFQRQAVAVARLFVTRPAVLVLDRPFAALSSSGQDILLAAILRLWQDTRPQIVLAGLETEQALLLAERLLVLRPGGGIAAGFVNLDPRPRDRNGLAFQALKREIGRALRVLPAPVAGQARQAAAAM